MDLDRVSRRDALRLAALFTAAGAAPLLRARAARAQADADAPLRIGYLPITDATPLLVAHANGLYEAEGLRAQKPVLMRSWAQLVEAFLAGQVDVVHVLSPMAIWARFAPVKAVHFGRNAVSPSGGRFEGAKPRRWSRGRTLRPAETPRAGARRRGAKAPPRAGAAERSPRAPGVAPARRREPGGVPPRPGTRDRKSVV